MIKNDVEVMDVVTEVIVDLLKLQALLPIKLEHADQHVTQLRKAVHIREYIRSIRSGIDKLEEHYYYWTRNPQGESHA